MKIQDQRQQQKPIKHGVGHKHKGIHPQVNMSNLKAYNLFKPLREITHNYTSYYKFIIFFCD